MFTHVVRTHTHTQTPTSQLRVLSAPTRRKRGALFAIKSTKKTRSGRYGIPPSRNPSSPLCLVSISAFHTGLSAARAQLGNFAHLTNGVCALIARMIQGGLSLQSLLSLSLYFACDVPPLSAAAWLPGDCVSSSHVRGRPALLSAAVAVATPMTR